MIQLNPPIPVTTPKGSGLAQALIDDGLEHDLKWVCFIDSTGECWTFRNRDVRAQKNITQGREYISPFYDPDDVAFPKPECYDQLLRDHELIQDTKNGLEKICRDQLDEIENLYGGMSKKDHFINDLLRQNKEQAARLVRAENQVIELRKMLTNEEENEIKKRDSESDPNGDNLRDFKDATRLHSSVVDNSLSKKIQEVASEVRGNEMKILDDFCKAYYAAEMKMTGKDFMSIVNEVTLNIQSLFKDGHMATKYWFSPKDN